VVGYCLAEAGIRLADMDVVAVNQDAGANLWKKLSAIDGNYAACASAGVRFFGEFGRLNAIWGDSPAFIAMSIRVSSENK